jgi:hypothetical protein
MSYLDIEHFLGLRGSDTWSSEGNESQIITKKAIGEVIHLKTPPADKLPTFYYKFAERLTAYDLVLTFNYDVLLERALLHVGNPFRLFPSRYKSVSEWGGTVDDTKKEVTILKMHGSVDWFDNRHFLELQKVTKNGTNLHTVFDNPDRYGAKRIVDGPRPANDPLSSIFRIEGVDEFYRLDRGFNGPFILSPSHVKFVYATTLLDFWHGMNRGGGWNLGVNVIGFSLPKHDEYIRIGLWNIITNYQQSWWDEKLIDFLKDYVRLIDLRTDDASISEYKDRYCFVDPGKTRYFFNGMCDEVIPFLFEDRRTA